MTVESIVTPERKWLDLSLAQQSVWLDAKVTGTSVYQLGGWARVEAPLDEAAVRQSVRLLMARHDALRLRVDDELPRQWLDDGAEPPITVHGLQGDTEGSHLAFDDAFKAFLENAFDTSMPLGDQPLFRIELLHVGPKLHYVLWRFHHLIADSMSVSITLAHWSEAYEALTGSASHELAPPSSYLGTIAADAAYLESAAYHQNLAYWASRFDPLPPQLIADLDATRAHRNEAQENLPSASFALRGEQYARFEAIAKDAGTSIQRALFGLCAIALGRRYGQTDIVSGIALHRRDLSNRHALGMMAGVIAVRCDFDPFWTLGECVQSFSEQLDADLRHQRLPVDVLSRALGLSGTGRTGLFEVAMSYMPSTRRQNGGVGVSKAENMPFKTGTVSTKEASPISLHVIEEEAGAGVQVSLAVNTDFLLPGEAATLKLLLERAIARFLDEPDTRFEDLELIPAEERETVVKQWNQTQTEFEEGTLDGLFRAQAALTPTAIAVIGADEKELTYWQLDVRSTRLARQLLAGGVEPEKVVGVKMVRSTETIVALLAILKAGGAYLPLDPTYPEDRLDYMATDADAMLVLDSIDLVGGPGDLIDGFDEASMSHLPELAVHTDASRLAYVIYTSGTTGLPKGVTVEHRAAVNLAFARRACHDPLGPGDRVLAAISVGFDVSIGQLLLPLLAGATIVIAGEVKTMEADDFWSLLLERKVTHINSVPSFLDAILPSAPAHGLALKRLMLGGEALTGSLVGRIHAALPNVEIVNMYGPTETCIDATFHVATDADHHAVTLPIGKPLSNYKVYVLDPQMQAVGIGVTGELYVGGAGLARGYRNAPELTAERFIPDVFSGNDNARLYRTGDRARWRADGDLEFLGRGDAQVKIRGFRVEPGEIAATLLGHADVSHAVVVPQPTDAAKPGSPLRLVAYFVPRSRSETIGSPALRAFLEQTLPDYMVPSAFVALAEMPLNRNGKLDLAALAAPAVEAGQSIPPRTPTQQTIATLFAEVLGIAQCGAHDHFFELGGHSLLAATLVSRMRAHGWTIPLRAIFETPTVEQLARRIDASLPTARQEVSIVPRPRPQVIALSLSQERIWFVDRLERDSSYNIPIAFHLHGPLDATAVARALDLIVERHEVLRTHIVLRAGKPVQEIQDQSSAPLHPLDLTGLETNEQQAALQKHLAELVAWRFDLANDPPLRLLLIALAPQHHVLAAVVHHVAFDGWSAGVFLGEFSAIYRALLQNETAALPPLAMQYADFALWQREQDRTADLAFWMDELSGAPSHLELPGIVVTDEARRSGTLPLEVDPAVYAALSRLARENNCSLFMLLHAAFALLLARWSGQDDVVLGTVTANRTHAEFEPLIGCFVNTLPLRTRFIDGESFVSLLSRVKSADLAAFAHQDLPFEQLVSALHIERSLDHTPIFQVMFVLQNTPVPALPITALTLEPITLDAETAKFDLTLSMAESAGGLTGTFEFAANRFSAAQVERLSLSFEQLLNAVVADSATDALAIDILDPAERALVKHAFNLTDASFPTGTLDALFIAQADQTPSAIAVIDLDGSALSYADVHHRSTELANRLIARGIKAADTVGVRMERSAATIIALLAILKAGAIYLPLDPDYPSDRLDYMIADANAALIIESLEDWTEILHIVRANDVLTQAAGPDRLAYVIYTSGTTGVPKGVAVAHRAAVNLAFARRAAHDPLHAGDRVLAAISVGFDVSIGQLLLPLLSGATVVIAGELKSMAPAAFWAFLAQRGVTHINSVPSFLQSVLFAIPHAIAGELSLQRLMLGGEALSGSLVEQIHRTLPGVEVVNMYGPTEACIDATFHVATRADYALSVLPIGRPLPNYRAYVLDAKMNPVSIGVTGELFLGGAGLANGYVNAPALTAERFVPDPFSDIPEAKLYRTGDRARWSSDGSLDFLGRVDQQIKIRGYRVEPGEIEARMRQLPGVREAAVIAESIEGGVRLIAYYTGEPTETAPQHLRASLAASLPDYMVPAAFVPLDHLPLSLNGKLDRKALPAPTQESFAQRLYEAPIGDVEQRMATLWAELLQLEMVGRHDNFFELGGHSLLAVTLMERMAEQQLPGDVRGLFTTPTVASLVAASSLQRSKAPVPSNLLEPGCAAITPGLLPLVTLQQQQIDAIVASVPGGAANVQDIYPLAPLQEGILFQHRISTGGDPYLTPFLLRFDNRPRLDGFLHALDLLIQRHDVLRTAMYWESLDSPVQVVQRQVALPFEEATLPDSGADASAHLLASFDPRIFRLDLTQAPLLRVAYTHDPLSNDWLLLLLTHHLILDHTSLEVLMYELRTLMAKPETSLPSPVSYRNFIAQAASDFTEAEHEAFFEHMLSDAEEPTIPFGLSDMEAPETAESRLVLEASLASQIRRHSRTLGMTPASLFHLAWATVLGHIAGSSDVVFGTVLFGRMQSAPGQSGASSMVGMTINTLPLRLRIDESSVVESLRAMHRRLTELMVHEHAPLALAQRASNVPASTPLFSSLFNYRYSVDASSDTAWPGVEMVHAAERTNYPLAMAVDDLGSGFTLTALAQPGPYAAQATRYLHHALNELVRLLDHAPSTAIQSVEVLPAAERTALLASTSSSAPPASTLNRLFESQAQATPHAIAVIDVDGTELTYAELNTRSTHLAQTLRARLPHTVREPVVGVHMERSTATVLALLAILKAGAVYLPLDPAYPADRLEYMAKDAGAVLILDSLAELEAEGTAVATRSELPPTELRTTSDASNLAYIIYTSGTSGLPKGVAMEHRAAVNLAYARRAGHDPLGVGDRVLAAISVGFDVSIGQLLLPLLSGATVIIAGDLKTLGAAEFWTLLADRQVTHINSVPSFFDAVLSVSKPEKTLALKRLMLGGEALSGSLVQRLWDTFPNLEIVNMYGPTEVCIDATFHVATPDDTHTAVLPIGRPLENYQAYILNGRLQPVPPGVAGELFLGGVSLARGYVNAPELTAERFLPNPFSTDRSDRIYRTGDLAQWGNDGAIEFLGRRDSQVKIRGFRVELGEIEVVIRRLPGIREAAVLASQGAGGMRLIAYFTGDSTLAVESLRGALAASLPDYMVPSAFMHLEALPLTINGKLDHKALPEPGSEDLAMRAFEPAATPDEIVIAQLWAELLKLDQVSRLDNFFELGGHSLLAVTLIERMRQQGLPCDVRTLFTTPTVAGLAASLGTTAQQVAAPENLIVAGGARITPEMLPLATLTQAQIDHMLASVPGGAANVQDIYPLAPLQQGILLQHRMSASGDPYLSPMLLGFKQRGALDAFLAALQQLVQRHDVLRTAMRWEGLEEPVQIVLRNVELPVDEIALDLAQDAETQLLSRFDPRTFRLDLTCAPLLRAAVAWDEQHNRWLLLLLTHHLILDHTSLEIIVRELRTLIDAPTATLPNPVPYRNFIAQTLQSPADESHEDFFKRMLGDITEPTAPFGNLDTQTHTAPAAEGRLTLDGSLNDAIRNRARSLGVTPASLFHVAWAAVLGHISERDDVVFGTVLFGRMRSAEGADRVVGMFINTLPLRLQLGSAGVTETVLHTHRLLAELMAHEHAPLALAQRASAVPPPAPLFSSLFNYRYNAPQDEAITWPGVEVIRASESTNYPLAVAVEDSSTDFTLIALAQPDADATRICAYLQHAVRTLLATLERAPNAPVSSLQVLPLAERTEVLEAHNRTLHQFSIGTLEELFVAQCQRTPNATAVIGLDCEELTYSELNARSTAIALHLIAHGIQAGDVVGVRFARSADTVVALLAILKAGGVYLPLDPAYPSDRLAFMASDAGAALVLDAMPLLSSDAYEPTGLPILTDPERLAYIIYTSGTTGLPKGVAVTHRAAVNLAFARRAAHDPIEPGDRVLAATSVGFDVSIGQLLLPLLAGATLVIAGELKTAGAAEFWTMLVEQRVTHINSVPSFFASILEDVPPIDTLALKRLMLGGEALTGAFVARLHHALPAVQVINMYGPTEACIDATFHIATEADHALAVLPIGQPLPNYRAYVLDRSLRPAGIGVAGELYLGGAGLAEGYVNAPQLTSERFVPDPFIPDERLYRTGDRARRRLDGAIEFLGRIDNQVKIRGFRVEPDEIAAALRQHTAVREAAVVASTTDGSTRLIAYFTGLPTLTPRELRSFLAATLPDYMVPAAYVWLDHMPLSLNGKLDGKALPAPSDEAFALNLYEAPIGGDEIAMASLWADALRLERIGRHDNFFELGGDSLGAMRLITAINAGFAIDLPVRVLFQHPTIGALAANLHPASNDREPSRNLVPIQPRGDSPRLFVVHGLSGHIFHYMPLIRALGTNQPVFGLQATGLEHGEISSGSIAEMAATYADAIQTTQPHGPYHLLGYSAGGLLAFAMGQALVERGEEVAFLALLDTSLPNPEIDRTISDEDLMLGIAGSLGLADLATSVSPAPTLAELVELARTLERLPAAFAVVHVERMAQVFRHMISVCPDYPLRPWDGPMLFLSAQRNKEELTSSTDWSRIVSGRFRQVDLHCNHLDLVSPHMVTTVADAIITELASAAASHRSPAYV